MNGFFMGIIENVVNSKAETKCTQSKLWVVIQCFVGWADEAIETFYTKAGVTDIKNAAANSEKDINETEKGAQNIAKDAEVKKTLESKPQDNSLMGWLKAGYTANKDAVGKVVDSIKKN